MLYCIYHFLTSQEITRSRFVNSDDLKLLNIFEDIKKNIATLARQGTMGGAAGAAASGSRSGSAAIDDAAQEDYEREIRLSADNLHGYNKSVKKQIDATKKYIKALAVAKTTDDLVGATNLKNAGTTLAEALTNSSKLQNQLAVEYNRLSRSTVPEQILAFKNLIKGTDSLSNDMSKAQRNSSLLSASLIKRANEVDQDPNSLDYARYIAELSDAARNLPTSLLRSAKVIEEHTDEFGKVIFKDNLNADDFAALRAQVGEAGVLLREAFDGVADFDKIMEMGFAKAREAYKDTPETINGINDALIATAIKLQQDGIVFPETLKLKFEKDAYGKDTDRIDERATIEALSSQMGTLADEMDAFYRAAEKGTKGLDHLGVQVNSVAGAIKRNYLSIEGITNHLAAHLGELATLTGTIASLKKSASDAAAVFKEMMSFNIAQLPATYWQVQKASVEMGMTFEETTKYLAENKRMFAMYGTDAHAAFRSNLEDTLNAYGYTFKQGAEMVGPAIEAAIGSSINVRDANALDKFIGNTVKSFEQISAVVDLSVGEYAKLNSELFNSGDAMQNMVGMTQAQTLQYANSLEMQRNQLVLDGLSLQHAQDLIKAQEAQKRAKVMDKYKTAAMNMVQMQALGFSPDESKRAYDLEVKGRARSGEENTEYAKLQAKRMLAQEQQLSALAASGDQAGMDALSVMLERTNQGGTADDIGRAQLVAELKKKANADLTEAERSMLKGAGRGDADLASMGEAANAVSSVFSNSLVTSAWSATGSLVALALASGKLSMQFGLMSGGGLLKGILGKAGSVASTAGKVVTGAAGKLAGGGGMKLGGAILGGALMAYEGYDEFQTAEALEKSGQLTSSQATDKKVGAVTGTIGGIGGMLAGAKAGALAGGLLGAPTGPGALLSAGAGALIGGIVGGIAGKSISSAVGEGVSSAIGSPAASSSPNIIQPDNIKSKSNVNTTDSGDPESDFTNVKDADARQQLEILNLHMAEAVKLLSEMSGKDSILPSTFNPILQRQGSYKPALTTSTAYMTGRSS